MRLAPELSDALAELVTYPAHGFAQRVERCRELAAASSEDAAREVEAFAAFARTRELGECEEAYVRTFDANAERALEVGWQVFGEQYARGAFLVRMRELMRECAVPETGELPDHLTNVLRVLGRVDDERASMLVEKAVAPSLRRIAGDLAKRPDDPYGHAVRAIALALRVPVDAAPALGEVSRE